MALVAVLVLGSMAVVASRASTARAAASGQLSIIGPYAGSDATSFQEVLKGFMAKNPGVKVTYTAATGDVAAQLSRTSGAVTAPDVAVLPLPQDTDQMAAMARSGAIKPIEFVSKTVNADYAYSWKALGSVDGKLTGLIFKATNRSAFWYDVNAFKRLGLTAPTTWKQFQNVVATIKAHGLSPFAISGGSEVALPNLFQNVYLAFEGNHRYDDLAAGRLSWYDSSVTGSLGVLRGTFADAIFGGPAALGKSYAQSIRDVFGSPMGAYMVPGGSAVMPVVAASNAVRPLSQFGVFAFPRLNPKAAPRVIGDADAVVMAKDSEAARALVSYLATPDAAAIWAKRSGDFLSPNRMVGASSYAIPQMGQLAAALTSANTFRLSIADMKAAPFKEKMNLELRRYFQRTDTVGDVVSRLALASGENR
jgi:ABC-type glycerol-3-phosphate transport system substrate-binding protein